jgi:hypothetical protein
MDSVKQGRVFRTDRPLIVNIDDSLLQHSSEKRYRWYNNYLSDIDYLSMYPSNYLPKDNKNK